MWDNPRLLNAAANGLLAIALAGLVYAGFRLVSESPAFPLRTVRVGGDLRHVARADVVLALQGKVSGTFFTVDLESISALFQSIPWVRRAEVRREWPDSLEVKIEEHVALARWGQGKEPQLVNSHGELFFGRSEAALPLLSGPAGTEGEVARRYLSFRELLAPLALEPRQVALSSRLAWQLRLSNGLTVQLGHDSDRDNSLEERLEKFVSAYPQTVGKMARRAEYVDLRYPNGFAVRVPESRKPESRKTAHKRV
jgi:cell division protein FtsQ